MGTMIRMLRCELTPAERERKAIQITNLLEETEKLEEERSEKNKEYKDRISRKNARIKQLAEDHRLGGELRQIDCQEVRDERRGEISTQRIDNGAVIDKRAMTQKERQTELPGTGEKGEKPKGKPAAEKGKASARAGGTEKPRGKPDLRSVGGKTTPGGKDEK